MFKSFDREVPPLGTHPADIVIQNIYYVYIINERLILRLGALRDGSQVQVLSTCTNRESLAVLHYVL